MGGYDSLYCERVARHCELRCERGEAIYEAILRQHRLLRYARNDRMKDINIMFLLRTIIRFVPIILLVWVGVSALDMDGFTRAVWTPRDQSPFIHGLRPTSRVEASGNAIRLTGDPVYLSVSPPGDYERAIVKLWFRSNQQPMVELGATVNALAGQILLYPIWHQTLEHISWPSIREGDIVLYQRVPKYIDVSDFLDAPPELSRIATYHAELPETKTLPASWMQGATASLTSASLRGFHEFVTVTDGKDVVLDIVYMDMNRNPGADPVTVRVYQSGRLLFEKTIKDDGVEADTNASLGQQKLHIAVEKPAAGIVKVELNANADVYWREIRLSLPKMTFLSNVTVGDEVGYLSTPRAVMLFTDAQHLTVFTRHAEGVQKVTVGDEVVDVAVPHERYQVESRTAGLSSVRIPRGDVVLVTDGLLAFSESAFFDPFPVRLDDRTDLEKLNVDYVLARYQSPKKEDDWLVAEAAFDLPSLERERAMGPHGEPVGRAESLRFVVSAPRIGDRDASVEVARIEVGVEREPRGFEDVFRILLSKFEGTTQ